MFYDPHKNGKTTCQSFTCRSYVDNAEGGRRGEWDHQSKKRGGLMEVVAGWVEFMDGSRGGWVWAFGAVRGNHFKFKHCALPYRLTINIPIFSFV